MTNRRRYAHARQYPTLNSLERAAIREQEQIQRDLVTYGHDQQAAQRASQVGSIQHTICDVLPGFPAELREAGRQQLEQRIADIYASGPVGCTCEYWRCVESRPSLTERGSDQ